MDFKERMDMLKTDIAEKIKPYLERLYTALEDGSAQAFTFGYGHANGNEYVVLATREDMFELFGRKWCWQYRATEKQFAKFRITGIPRVDLETAVLNFTLRYGEGYLEEINQEH